MTTECVVQGAAATGEFSPVGLKTSGKVTEVTLSTSAWTALPVTALNARNAISIQNRSGVEIKLNFDNTVSGYIGVYLPDGYERSYDITDSIVLYAKASVGTPTIIVEELA